MASPDDHADALYGLPLDRFVAERDALAKQLRAEGDRAAADAVKKLPKPTVAAAAVNAAVREHSDAASELAESARMLREAQEELLAGGDADALRAAGESARKAIDALIDAAPVSGEATKEKVRDTLHAATVDPDVLADVMGGRLTRERTASGFAGLAPAAGKAAAPAKGRATSKKPRDDSRRREKLRRAKEAEAAAEHEVEAARHALAQVESALAERRSELREAETRLKDARRRRERVERAA
jgi:hypothetical protein